MERGRNRSPVTFVEHPLRHPRAFRQIPPFYTHYCCVCVQTSQSLHYVSGGLPHCYVIGVRINLALPCSWCRKYNLPEILTARNRSYGCKKLRIGQTLASCNSKGFGMFWHRKHLATVCCYEAKKCLKPSTE